MKRTVLRLFASGLLGLMMAGQPAHAALNVYVEMTINGQAIDGDTTAATVGGVNVSVDHLECTAVNHEIFGGGTGRLSHTPFKLIKKIDKSTPLLYGALDETKTVQATIKYFNNDPDSGVTQHFFTVRLEQARISAIRQWIPNNLEPAAAIFPPMEEVSITYQTITITSETGSTDHEINVN